MKVYTIITHQLAVIISPFFVFFETFVRVLFESSSNQLRKKGTFCEQNSSLTATWFNSNPYLFSSKCHIKFWYNKKPVSCLCPASKEQADINYPFLIHSFDFPLTLLWVGLRFFNKLLSIKNTFVYLVVC